MYSQSSSDLVLSPSPPAALPLHIPSPSALSPPQNPNSLSNSMADSEETTIVVQSETHNSDNPALAESDLEKTSAEALTAGIEEAFVKLSVVEEEIMPFTKPNGGFLVGAILQKRKTNAAAMEALMFDKLWHPIHQVQMQVLEENLFLFGFAHQMDLQKVIREGPWRFNKHFLVLHEITDPAQASRAVLTKIPIWMHIVDVPAAWLTIQTAVEIAKRVGRVIEVDPDSAGPRGLGYLRVRIELEAAAPLPRKITVGAGDNSKEVAFLYERLENYCYRCGYMDHTEFDCPNRFNPAKKDEFGWMEERSVLPPIKRPFRQQTQRAGKQRVFGSVSPIEGAWRSVRGQENREVKFVRIAEEKVQKKPEERIKKRAFVDISNAPPGFYQNTEEKVVGIRDQLMLTVGEEAHLRE